jgi:hypothetical protein
MGKSWRADAVEPLVWSRVSDTLMDPKRLRAGLERLVEEERVQGQADPDKEARKWSDKLSALERKRGAFQDMAAEGLITFDELRTKLVELQDGRKAAQMKLEAIERRRERIQHLEKNAEEVIRFYAEALPEDLRTLGPEDRREVYRMLRLRIEAYPDGALLASGALDGEQPVFTSETTSLCCGRSTPRPGPVSSPTTAGSARSCVGGPTGYPARQPVA